MHMALCTEPASMLLLPHVCTVLFCIIGNVLGHLASLESILGLLVKMGCYASHSHVCIGVSTRSNRHRVWQLFRGTLYILAGFPGNSSANFKRAMALRP